MALSETSTRPWPRLRGVVTKKPKAKGHEAASAGARRLSPKAERKVFIIFYF